MLSLRYGPTLISLHDCWKNHSFDYMNLCQQSNVSALIHCLGLSQLSFQGEVSFNFMALVTIHSAFGAQENINKIYHCFHVSPFFLP